MALVFPVFLYQYRVKELFLHFLPSLPVALMKCKYSDSAERSCSLWQNLNASVQPNLAMSADGFLENRLLGVRWFSLCLLVDVMNLALKLRSIVYQHPNMHSWECPTTPLGGVFVVALPAQTDLPSAPPAEACTSPQGCVLRCLAVLTRTLTGRLFMPLEDVQGPDFWLELRLHKCCTLTKG